MSLQDFRPISPRRGEDALKYAFDRFRELALTFEQPSSPGGVLGGTIDIVDTLPDFGNEGRVVFLTTDQKLYRDTGTAWTAAVATVDLTGTITETQLADGAVTTVKLGPASVTESKIGAEAVTEAKIGAASVTSTKIGTSAVTEAKIGDLAVTTTKIGTGSVVEAKIGDLAVTTTKLADGSVLTAKIGAGAVDVSKFATGLRPVEIVDVLPAPGTDGRIVYLTTDNKLYRDTGVAWTAAVPTTDLSGQITETQITDAAISTPKLATDAVTADKILAGTITTDEIAANTIVAGNIAAGAIGTDQLAANSVMAKQLLVGSFDNLVQNPGFEASTTEHLGWRQAGSGTWSVTGSGAQRSGSVAAIFDPTGQSSEGRLQASTDPAGANTDGIAVTEGDQVYGEAYVRAAIAGSVNNVRVGFYFRDRTGVAVGSAFSTYIAPTTTYQKISISGAAPAGTAQAVFELNVQNTGHVVDIVFDDAYVRRMVAGEIVVDGAITADKIAADAVVAGKIAAGAIAADEIAANTIVTSMIAAGQVTANEIAANTITAAEIAASAITATELAANAVTADKILAGAVTAAAIDVTQLSAISADMGVLTAGVIQDAATKFKIDLANVILTVDDAQAVPVSRIRLGKLGALSTDYGIEVYTSGGSLILGATGLGVDVVGASQIQSGAIGTLELGDASVTTTKLVDGSVLEAKIGDLAVTSTKLATGAVVEAKIGDLAVTSTKLGGGAVTEAKILGGAVTTTKLADSAVTEAKIGTSAVTITKLADGTITQVKMATGLQVPTVVASLPAPGTQGRLAFLTTDSKLYRDTGAAWTAVVPTTDLTGTITETQIADNSISTGKIQANAITAAKILTGTITADKLVANSITAGQIAASAIGASELAAGSVVAGKIAAGAIAADEIAAGTIVTTMIAAGQVTTNEIAANTIVAGNIAAGTITATEIATNTLTATQIAAGAITASELATNAVTAVKILAGAVTADKINVTSLSAIEANMGTITAGQIAVGGISISADTERILFGAATAPLTGEGIFIGKDGLDYEFRIGDPVGNKYIHWDGASLDAYGLDMYGAPTVQEGQFTVFTNLTLFDNVPLVLAGNNQITHDGNVILTGTRVLQNVTADASIINAGTFGSAQIPSLDMSKITTGNLAASRVSAGTFSGTFTFNSTLVFGQDGTTQYIRTPSAGGAIGFQTDSATAVRGLRFGKVDNAAAWTEHARFDDSGNFTVTDNITAAAFFESSFRGWKRDIEDWPLDLRAFMALRPRTWVGNGEGPLADGVRGYGFVSDEVAEFFTSSEGKTVGHNRIATQTVLVVQDLVRRVEELEAEHG